MKKILRFLKRNYIDVFSIISKDVVDMWMLVAMTLIGIYLAINGNNAGYGILFYSVYVSWLIVRKNTWKYNRDQINAKSYK